MDFKLTITIDASTALLGAINGLTEALTSRTTQQGTIVETRTIKAPVEGFKQTATTQTQEVETQTEVKGVQENSAAPTARDYTVEEVRKIVAEKAKVNEAIKEAAKGALHSLGATSISTLPKEKYPELMDLLNAF